MPLCIVEVYVKSYCVVLNQRNRLECTATSNIKWLQLMYLLIYNEFYSQMNKIFSMKFCNLVLIAVFSPFFSSTICWTGKASEGFISQESIRCEVPYSYLNWAWKGKKLVQITSCVHLKRKLCFSLWSHLMILLWAGQEWILLFIVYWFVELYVGQ